jgi:hypothetical protein
LRLLDYVEKGSVEQVGGGMQRRHFLRSGTACSVAIAFGMTTEFRLAHASEAVGQKSGNILETLARTLRAIGTHTCITAAEKLEERGIQSGDFSFLVRDAGIDSAGAAAIATALNSVSRDEARALVSFSLSYNVALGDTGAIALAKALPPTLGALGLVGCGIGEAGGSALHEWASNARGLRMICIENNQLSNKLKARFRALPGALAYV